MTSCLSPLKDEDYFRFVTTSVETQIQHQRSCGRKRIMILRNQADWRRRLLITEPTIWFDRLIYLRADVRSCSHATSWFVGL